MMELDNINKKLLNILQADFPIIEKPFEYIGKKFNILEDEVIERIRVLKEEKGIIRQISGIFDTKMLGYKSSLVACRISEKEIDEKAEIINKHPGVSHNYKRDSEYNLWFTIAVPPDRDLEKNCKELFEHANISDFMILPALKVYKIGVKFEFEDDERNVHGRNANRFDNEIEREKFDKSEIKYIRILQNDLPLVHNPFCVMAERNSLSEKDLINFAKQFLKPGKMRRFAAVINHRSAGFLFNAMAVWNVGDERVDECGKIIAGFNQVSHCYRRATYPKWNYPLYSMIHARTKEQCENIILNIAEKIKPIDYKVLYSLKEYKKERIKYYIRD